LVFGFSLDSELYVLSISTLAGLLEAQRFINFT
jgi:hypothetical protein